MTQAMTNQRRWCDYLGERTGTYEFRSVRYRAVADLLKVYNLTDDDLIVDVGAGYGDFDVFLRTEAGFRGRYLPIDGCLDGTDLEQWVPNVRAAFFTCIETLEHLHQPGRLLRAMQRHADKAVVMTTPNAETVNVLEIDDTHVTPITMGWFEDFGCNVASRSFFGKPEDSLLAWWETP